MNNDYSNISLQFDKKHVIIKSGSNSYKAAPPYERTNLKKEGNEMNYYEWSQEYKQTAAQLDKVIKRLLNERKGKCESTKKEISDKISFYRCCKYECLRVAEHLMQRHLGVA